MKLRDTDALLQSIQDAVPMSQMVERIMEQPVEFRRAGGGELRMGCPFHNDHDPSLWLNEGKYTWICRVPSCVSVTDAPDRSQGGKSQGGGGITRFVRLYHGDTREEALVRLAALAGVDIQPFVSEPTEQEKARDAAREELRQMLAKCEPCNEWRDIDPGVLSRYEVRWAPGHLRWAAGRLSWDDSGPKLILPVRDDERQLVGWTTRNPGDSKDSRNNPNEWPGHEPDVLYGLHEARAQLRRNNYEVIVVEGQSDVLAMASHHIEPVVGLRGGALTEGRWRRLMRWSVQRVTLCLDGDKAGQAASRSACEKFWDEPQVILSVAQLPEGRDPADLLGEDPMVLKLALTRPAGDTPQPGRLVDSAEFLLRELIQDYDTSTITGQRAFIERALRGLGMSRAKGVTRHLITSWIARTFGLPTLEITDLFLVEGTPIVSEDAERAVLARAMREPTWINEIQGRLDREHFLLVRHQLLWELIMRAHRDGVPADDMDALAEYGIRLGYAREVVSRSFLELVLSRYREDAPDWALTAVIDAAFRRGMQARLRQADQVLDRSNFDADEVVSELTAYAIDKTFWLRGVTTGTSERVVEDTIEGILERMKNPNQITGFDLGPCMPQLNRVLSGIQKRRLTVVAAAQSVGKTSFLNNLWAEIAIRASVPTLVIGLEMEAHEYLHRVLGQMTGIDASRITNGLINKAEAEKVVQAGAVMQRAPLYFECPDMLDQDGLMMMVRRYKALHGIECVFFDYAQLIAPSREQVRMSRYEMLGEFAKTVKLRIARAQDVAFVTAAQLNRDGAKDKRPSSENIGDSYQLVQTADTVLILSEAEGNATAMDLYVDKNRQGNKDVLIPLRFDRPSQTIWEAAGGRDTPSYRI